jgi:hypothetical protein
MKVRWITKYSVGVHNPSRAAGGNHPKTITSNLVLQCWNKKLKQWRDVPIENDNESYQAAHREVHGVRSPRVVPVKTRHEKEKTN